MTLKERVLRFYLEPVTADPVQQEAKKMKTLLRHYTGPSQNLFERFVENSLANSSYSEKAGSACWNPKVDIEETEKEFIVSMDLPGLEKEEISIRALGNILSVSGERKNGKDTKTKNIRYSERFYGSFDRSLRIPEDIKLETIQAEYKSGVLEILIPKTDGEKIREISIQ